LRLQSGSQHDNRQPFQDTGDVAGADSRAGQALHRPIDQSNTGSTDRDWPGRTTSISGAMTAIPMARAMGDIEAEAPGSRRIRTGRPNGSQPTHVTGHIPADPMCDCR